MPAPNRCEVCGEPTPAPIGMCSPCVRSYIDTGLGDRSNGGYLERVLWAARRARWYAERRAAKNARAAVEREGKRRTR